ncbi:MAG: hypothetical protein GF409_05635 [Candidatus Omnitrophica bacterium]|nr:hypothetical protein [Candidatus Omnitrophota bacterium]
MRSIDKAVLSVFLIVLFMTRPVGAAQAPSNLELMNQLRELRQIVTEQGERITELERSLSQHKEELSGYKCVIEEHEELINKERLRGISAEMRKRLEGLKTVGPIEVGASATFMGQGTPSANSSGGDKQDDRFDASWTAEIELAKSFGEWGYAYILMEPGQGSGLNEDLSLFSPVNFDAAATGSSPNVTEVWYEQYLCDNCLAVTFGKLYFPNYLDTNEYANDENRQFFSGMFRNADTIDFPGADQCLGARASFAPRFADYLTLEAMWGETDSDYEQVFDHPFIATQLNLAPAKFFGYDAQEWGGNYRMYFWYNGEDHTKIKAPEETKLNNYGLGISCDQKITDMAGIFARFSWQDPVVSDIEYHWSLGGQLKGGLWNRNNDVFAVGVGQAIPGAQYGKRGNPNGTETHIETYYSVHLNEHVAVSPDIQCIWSPNGVKNSEQGERGPIFVYGIRTFIDF